MGVVWRSMALMGVIGRCGVVMIQRSSSATSVTTAINVSTTLRAASTLYCFNGIQGTCMPRRPRKIGPTTSTHARVRVWTLQGKASNGIDIHWQATNAGMSAFRDDGGCGKHGGRGRICGASVGSVAVVASVACVASVAVVASVACVTSVPRDAWGARDAWDAWGARKAYGFIRLVLISCPFQRLHR